MTTRLAHTQSADVPVQDRPAATEQLAGLLLRFALLVISLAIAVVVVVVRPGGGIDDGGDYRTDYAPTARNLLAGRGLRDVSLSPEVRYPPGYPLVLAETFRLAGAAGFDERTGVAALNIISMGVSSLLVFSLAARVWGARLALAPWAAWTTYPFVLYLLTGPTSEMPFIVALLAALYAIVGIVRGEEPRRWRYVACGVLVGCAMLIRPIAIGLGGVFALLVGVGAPRRRLLAATLLLAGNLLAVMPWEIWAYRSTGDVIALSRGNVVSMIDGLTFGVRLKRFRTGTWIPAAGAQVMQDISRQDLALVSTAAIGRVLAREFTVHPLGVLELVAMKIARAWYGTDSQRAEGVGLMTQAVYLSALTLSTVIAWRAGGYQRRLVIGVCLIAAYFWAMTVLALSILRYMVPTMSLLMLLLPALLLYHRRPHIQSAAIDMPPD